MGAQQYEDENVAGTKAPEKPKAEVPTTETVTNNPVVETTPTKEGVN